MRTDEKMRDSIRTDNLDALFCDPAWIHRDPEPQPALSFERLVVAGILALAATFVVALTIAHLSLPTLR